MTLRRAKKDDDSKVRAFTGLCQMIQLNPNGMFSAPLSLLLTGAGVVGDFVFFADAVSSWSNPPPELYEAFRQVCSLSST